MIDIGNLINLLSTSNAEVKCKISGSHHLLKTETTHFEISKNCSLHLINNEFNSIALSIIVLDGKFWLDNNFFNSLPKLNIIRLREKNSGVIEFNREELNPEFFTDLIQLNEEFNSDKTLLTSEFVHHAKELKQIYTTVSDTLNVSNIRNLNFIEVLWIREISTETFLQFKILQNVPYIRELALSDAYFSLRSNSEVIKTGDYYFLIEQEINTSKLETFLSCLDIYKANSVDLQKIFPQHFLNWTPGGLPISIDLSFRVSDQSKNSIITTPLTISQKCIDKIDLRYLRDLTVSYEIPEIFIENASDLYRLTIIDPNSITRDIFLSLRNLKYFSVQSTVRGNILLQPKIINLIDELITDELNIQRINHTSQIILKKN